MAYFHAVVRHFVKRYLALQVFWDQLLDYWYDTVLFFNTVNNRMIQVTAIRSRRSKAIDPVVVIYFVCVLLSHCLLLTSN
jgi:hypothetical protein